MKLGPVPAKTYGEAMQAMTDREFIAKMRAEACFQARLSGSPAARAAADMLKPRR